MLIKNEALQFVMADKIINIIDKNVFLIPQAKMAHSLPVVMKNVSLFAAGMRKNTIRNLGVNKECLKQQLYHPRLCLGR